MDELDDPPQPGAPKKPAIPRFSVQPVKLEFQSAQAGRDIYEDREFVDIIIPGDRRAMVHEPVSDEHKARWPREYAAFKAGREAPLTGTPLLVWPGMSRSRVEELAYFHIRTVEELAEIDDGRLQALGMGARQEREKAKLFLEAARTGSAPLERMLRKNDDLTLECERLQRELMAAYAENARLRAMLERQQESLHAGNAA